MVSVAAVFASASWYDVVKQLLCIPLRVVYFINNVNVDSRIPASVETIYLLARDAGTVNECVATKLEQSGDVEPLAVTTVFRQARDFGPLGVEHNRISSRRHLLST